MKYFLIAVAFGIPVIAFSTIFFAPLLQVSVRMMTDRKITYGLSVHIAFVSTCAAYVFMVAAALAIPPLLVLLPIVALFSTAFFLRDMLFFELRLSLTWGKATAASVLYMAASTALMIGVGLVARTRL